MCYYCNFGLPPKVREIFDRVEDVADSAAHFGPGHVVFEDTNLDDDCIKDCIEDINNHKFCRDFTDEELMVVKKGLEDLLALSREDRKLDEAEKFNNENY